MADLVLQSPEARSRLFRGYYRMLCQDYGPPFFFKSIFVLIALVQTILAIEADKFGAEDDSGNRNRGN